jgi:hypothetical protein
MEEDCITSEIIFYSFYSHHKFWKIPSEFALSIFLTSKMFLLEDLKSHSIDILSDNLEELDVFKLFEISTMIYDKKFNQIMNRYVTYNFSKFKKLEKNFKIIMREKDMMISLTLYSALSNTLSNILKENKVNEYDLSKYSNETVEYLFKKCHKVEIKIKDHISIFEVFDMAKELDFHQYLINFETYIKEISNKKFLAFIKKGLSDNINLEKIENLVQIFSKDKEDDPFFFKLQMMINISSQKN